MTVTIITVTSTTFTVTTVIFRMTTMTKSRLRSKRQQEKSYIELLYKKKKKHRIDTPAFNKNTLINITG